MIKKILLTAFLLFVMFFAIGLALALVGVRA